jgi:hypothetical protein
MRNVENHQENVPGQWLYFVCIHVTKKILVGWECGPSVSFWHSKTIVYLLLVGVTLVNR